MLLEVLIAVIMRLARSDRSASMAAGLNCSDTERGVSVIIDEPGLPMALSGEVTRGVDAPVEYPSGPSDGERGVLRSWAPRSASYESRTEPAGA